MAVCHPEHSGPPAAIPPGMLGQPGMLWGTPMTAQEGTDQNLRATNYYKQKGEPAEEDKGEVRIPDSGKLSMALQPAKFSTLDHAKEPPDHRDSRDGAKLQFENHRDFQSMYWQHPKALLTCADLEWPASAGDISPWLFGCSGCSTILNPPAMQCIKLFNR